MEYGKCAYQSTNKIITAEEHKRKLTLNNPNQKTITKIQVDGCLKITSGKRCDFMFEIDQPTTHVIYLELKGCDVAKAYEQLISTLYLFKEKHKNCKKECHIVASRVPKAGTKIQQLKVKMQKETMAKLVVNTNKVTIAV